VTHQRGLQRKRAYKGIQHTVDGIPGSPLCTPVYEGIYSRRYAGNPGKRRLPRILYTVYCIPLLPFSLLPQDAHVWKLAVILGIV
jgi:hypothetical protein